MRPGISLLDAWIFLLEELLAVAKAAMGAVELEGQLLAAEEADLCLFLWIISYESALEKLLLSQQLYRSCFLGEPVLAHSIFIVGDRSFSGPREEESAQGQSTISYIYPSIPSLQNNFLTDLFK